MSIRKILVPLSGQYDPADPETLEKPALETAFVVAEGLQAHLEVFCIEAEPGDARGHLAPWIPEMAVDELLDVIEEESGKRRAGCRAMFETVADRFKAPRISSPDSQAGFSVNFLEQTGELHEWLARRGRLADLIVTACPPLGKDRPLPSILEISLRESGRPVLISRDVSGQVFPQTVAIAWNGSAEATRAVAFAMDFLNRADEVLAISVQEDGRAGPSADSLCEYLAWHGVRARAVTVDGTAASAGPLILEQLSAGGADLLVMGAYTRNRLRRVIFGGVTNAVLDQMTVPVLMVD